MDEQRFTLICYGWFACFEIIKEENKANRLFETDYYREYQFVQQPNQQLSFKIAAIGQNGYTKDNTDSNPHETNIDIFDVDQETGDKIKDNKINLQINLDHSIKFKDEDGDYCNSYYQLSSLYLFKSKRTAESATETD